MINFFGIKLNLEEIFVGACFQWPIYFILHWRCLPVMLVCGILWALGGAAGGSKLFRRIGVPLVICGGTYLVFREWPIFIAVPFMIWLSPSYGEESLLFRFYFKATEIQGKADLLTRLTLFFLYWMSFCIFLIFGKNFS